EANPLEEKAKVLAAVDVYRPLSWEIGRAIREDIYEERGYNKKRPEKRRSDIWEIAHKDIDSAFDIAKNNAWNNVLKVEASNSYTLAKGEAYLPISDEAAAALAQSHTQDLDSLHHMAGGEDRESMSIVSRDQFENMAINNVRDKISKL
ncbi:MAG: hypothetical protein UT60_C0050G0011, partial [candidate division CPR2 bacterium GW2011_GWD2_39_7]